MKKYAYKSALCAMMLGFLALANAAYAQYDIINISYDAPLDSKKVGLQYDVYAGGFKALNAALILDLDKNAYDMELTASTQGMIGDLFPWKGNYATSGHSEAQRLTPNMHTATSTWRGKITVTELSFDPNGGLLKVTTQKDGKTKIKRDLDKALTDNSVDMLTGILLMFQNSKNTGKCAGTFPVFDGKRRFDIILKDDGTDFIHKSKFSSFTGEALRCKIKVEPVGGFVKKDSKRGWMAVQAHTEERKKPPTIWLAPLKDGGQIIPVKMEIASAYGSVVAHLTKTSRAQ